MDTPAGDRVVRILTAMATPRGWYPLCFKHFSWTFFSLMKFKNNATERHILHFVFFFISNLFIYPFNDIQTGVLYEDFHH